MTDTMIFFARMYAAGAINRNTFKYFWKKEQEILLAANSEVEW